MENATSGYLGQCYCGQIKFLIAADVTPNVSCYCHCESCRRAHSAPLYHVVYVPIESFDVIEGKHLLQHFSKGDDCIVRSFCQNCGSRIHNVCPPKPALGIGFFPALLKENVQQNLPQIFKPTKHYLSEETVLPLDLICDNLPREVVNRCNSNIPPSLASTI